MDQPWLCNNNSPNDYTSSGSWWASQALIWSVYNTSFDPTIKAIISSTRFNRKQNLREVDLQNLKYFCTCIFVNRGVVTGLTDVPTFFRRWHLVVLDAVDSSQKLSAFQTWIIHRYAFNSWQRALRNNSRITFIVPLS